MRECKTCKYSGLTGHENPCRLCGAGGMWEPKDTAIEIDPINHPAHYEGNTSLECIDVMEIAFGAEAVGNFCLCNAFKYLWRYKHKGGDEDVKKAKWYLDRWTQTAGRYTECEAYQKMRDMAEEIV